MWLSFLQTSGSAAVRNGLRRRSPPGRHPRPATFLRPHDSRPQCGGRHNAHRDVSVEHHGEWQQAVYQCTLSRAAGVHHRRSFCFYELEIAAQLLLVVSGAAAQRPFLFSQRVQPTIKVTASYR